jgi:inosine-uridine nucleoside N-ribohydrolase
MALAVETRGELTSGMVVVDRRRGTPDAPTAGVCVDVEAERFLRLFTERILE